MNKYLPVIASIYALLFVGPVHAASGMDVYNASCAMCHVSGVAGALKLTDKAGWEPRLKAGTDALYASSLKGKGAMPAKGGNASLADADVKAAVDYMVSQVK
jgi:cytochrome c5